MLFQVIISIVLIFSIVRFSFFLLFIVFQDDEIVVFRLQLWSNLSGRGTEARRGAGGNEKALEQPVWSLG